MKILYAVQATGNGHISRAMELIPFFRNYGTVDIFLSGANSSLELSYPVKYRSKGLSLFYNCNGNLNYRKMLSSFSPLRIRKEINELPVEKYDLVLNDFECITSMACARKKIPSIHFGHQASFHSPNTPRPPEKNKTGEWILRNYAKGTTNIGLHFQRYDDFILPPVIKKDISNTEPSDQGHFTIYLPSYCEHVMGKYFHAMPEHIFHIFSFETKQIRISKNITFLPVNKNLFNHSLVNCTGIFTGGGFETPAEALKLKKKLMVMPIRGQYEQLCNAAALEKMGIKKIEKLSDDLKDHFEQWINTAPIEIDYSHKTEELVENVMKIALSNSNVKNVIARFPEITETITF